MVAAGLGANVEHHSFVMPRRRISRCNLAGFASWAIRGRRCCPPGADEQDGYVANVMYSCGAFLHDGLLWIRYGIDDCRIGVAYAPLDEVLADISGAS